jgi:hypothetical protein
LRLSLACLSREVDLQTFQKSIFPSSPDPGSANHSKTADLYLSFQPSFSILRFDSNNIFSDKMTYELFMNAIVSGADEAKARALLGGFTEMRERHQVTRVQHYEPEDTAVKGLPTIKQLQKERRPTAPQWQELHQILAKQPFILHVRTDTTEEAQKALNASAAAATSPGAGSGSVSVIPAVRWTDLPDPPNPQLPFITQRKVLDIADPDAQSILAANKFKLVYPNLLCSCWLILIVAGQGSHRTSSRSRTTGGSMASSIP